MYSILELVKPALIGKQIKIYIHRMSRVNLKTKGVQEWAIIDIEQPSENYLVRTIVDIKYLDGDCDQWDSCELILNEPVILEGKECPININYATKFDLVHE